MVESHVHREGVLAEPAFGAEPPQLFEGDPRRLGSSPRKMPVWPVVVAVLVLCVAAAFYFWRRGPEAPAVSPSIEPAPAQTAPPAAVTPPIRYPVESAQPASTPLPPLQDSDATVLDGIAGVVGARALELLRREDVIRHIVATVDNLPRRSVATRVLPVRPVPGRFATAGSGDDVAIAAENAARYAPYVQAAEAVDAKTLAALYVRFYPLFQQAYRELGYPNGNFNDRLVDAIDDMLAAPVVRGPIRLTQPKVLYEYANPDLEQRSAGQKIMMRMGNDNASRIAAKLREFRREVVGPNARP